MSAGQKGHINRADKLRQKVLLRDSGTKKVGIGVYILQMNTESRS